MLIVITKIVLTKRNSILMRHVYTKRVPIDPSNISTFTAVQFTTIILYIYHVKWENDLHISVRSVFTHVCKIKTVNSIANELKYIIFIFVCTFFFNVRLYIYFEKIYCFCFITYICYFYEFETLLKKKADVFRGDKYQILLFVINIL